MMIKLRSMHLNLVTLFSVIFLLGGILFAIFAASGVVIVVTFMFKIFAVLSVICFALAVILFFLRKMVKVTEVKSRGV